MVSLILCFSILTCICAPAFAASEDAIGSESNRTTTSFIDSEGKENTIIMAVLDNGDIYSELYINDELLNTAVASVNEDMLVTVQITEADSTTEVITLDMSHFTTTAVPTPSSITRTFNYSGRINYNPVYGYNYYLDIYQQVGNTTDVYKSINAAKDDLVNMLASAVASVLVALLFPASEALSVAMNLIVAAAASAGVGIAAGKITAAFTKRYYVRTTYYDVRAIANDSGNQRVYQGERFRLFLDGGGFSSDVYYDGYLPWDTTAVASWMFGDFWSVQYPGVKNFAYA